MTREMIEDYLDGALEAADRMTVERAAAADAQVAALLTRVKAQRALRAAALASYQPSAEEASAFAGEVLAACADEAMAPVGRVGPRSWARWSAGIAAALALSIGMFTAGRMTAAEPGASVVVDTQKNDVFRLVYMDSRDDGFKMRNFASADELNEYARNLQNSNGSAIAVADFSDLADLSESGHF